MKPGKSPGSDGLGRQFYLLFWDLIGPMVHESLAEGFKRGTLSDTQKLSIVRLIPKKDKDKRHLVNLRPISLMNFDTKIGSKVMNNRLEPLLHDLIGIQQNAYVPGRYIGNGIKTLQYIKEHSIKNRNKLMYMGLDIKKAFDSTSHLFLYNVMKKMNMGEKFIGYIKTLYKDAKAAVINLGKLTDYYPLERSCRQGDPISGTLFLLIIQSFLDRVLNNADIPGYSFNNKNYKISTFADDTTLILTHEDQIRTVLEISKEYSKVSGLESHPQKTELLRVHGNFNVDPLLELQEVESLKVLGVILCRCPELEKKLNYKPLIKKFEDTINTFRIRNLSIMGKTLVTKSLLVSKAQYLFSMISPDEESLKTLNRLMYNQFWGGCDSVKRIVLAKGYELGGLKLDNLFNVSKAAQAAWISRACQEQEPEWLEFFHFYSKKIGGIYSLNGKINPRILDRIDSEITKSIISGWIFFNNNPHKDSHLTKHCSIFNNIEISPNASTQFKHLQKLNVIQLGDFIIMVETP
jgi:hypothetical protein